METKAMNLSVRDVMTEAVLSVDVNDSVTEVMRIFAAYPVHHLPVIADSRVAGMVSSADILKLHSFLPKTGGLAAAGALLDSRFPLSTLMHRPPVTIAADASLAEAASSMVAHAIHALPVVTRAGHLLGIITTTDIMGSLLKGVTTPALASTTQSASEASDGDSRHVIKVARAALAEGRESPYIGEALLITLKRNALLEEMHQDVKRYLTLGQSPQVHARLLQELSRLDEADVSSDGRGSAHLALV
jgi:CBS domain-containing protein